MDYLRLIQKLLLVAVIFFTHTARANECRMPEQIIEATPRQIHDFFSARHATVVSFFGYSGAEYEDHAGMLARALSVLTQFDPHTTIINIGATDVGIGSVYELAKAKGFVTSGIVSSQARDQGVALSPCVDYVFYVKDTTWGGYSSGSNQLSPTSEAMVTSSNVLIGIGGGEIVRDELLEAKRRGKDVKFFPAEMNRRLAREKALSKGLPEPTDFSGEAQTVLTP